MNRRSVLAFGAVALTQFALLSCTSAPAAPVAQAPKTTAPAATTSGSPTQLRIGYQKGGALNLLKAQQTLEKRFGSSVNVTWTEFTAGPPILEAMNSGSVDVASTGETPPIFAEAAGTPLLYAATTLGSGAGQGIIVPANSPIHTVADLKGKKVAFNKASSAHLFIVRALEANGLQYTDINPVFLAPPDARAAFQGGSIDAWVIWDPFYSAAQQQLQAHVILDGKNLAQTRSYYLASQSFVKDHADVLRDMIDEFLTIWRQISSGETARFEGQYLHSDGGSLAFPTVQKPYPPLWFGGSSPAAHRVAAKHADVYLTWAEPPRMAAEQITNVRRLAEAEGRQVRFGMRMHVIVRETEREAWEAADRLIQHLDDKAIAAAQKILSSTQSVGQARMVSLHNGNRDSLVVSPNLWAGVGLVRGGAGTALVGDGKTVAARMQEYADLGVESFIFSGYPHLEEAYNTAEFLFPPLPLQKPVATTSTSSAEFVPGREFFRRPVAVADR